MPLRVATDPAYRGRGIFARAPGRERGARARARRPAAAHRAERRLGAGVPRTARLVAAAARSGCGRGCASGARTPRGTRVERFAPGRVAYPAGADRVLRDAAWLNWRFADSPTRVHAARGRRATRSPAGAAARCRRGRRGRAPARRGRRSGRPARDRRAAAVGAPALRARRATCRRTRTFTVLGKSLDPGQAVPARPHFELGDLDFSDERGSSSSPQHGRPGAPDARRCRRR